MVIDVHAHCIPPSFRDWLESHGAELGAVLVDSARGACVRFGDGPATGALRDDLSDLERRIAEMDRMGIDVQLLAGWIDLTGYELPAAAGRTYARAHNDCMAEEASKHPDRLLPMATVPLQDPATAAEELGRAMTELGMVGVQVATTVGEAWIDEAELDVFFEAAEDLGAFIVLHPMRPLSGVPLDRHFMSNMVGRPAETSIALSGLILSGVFERFPRLKLCAVHGGGFVPFQVGRLDRGYHQKPAIAGAHLESAPSASLAKVYVDTIVHDPDALGFLVATRGADRVVVGTDYPFEMGDDDPVSSVDAVPGLTAAARDAILSGNIRAIVGDVPTG